MPSKKMVQKSIIIHIDLYISNPIIMTNFTAYCELGSGNPFQKIVCEIPCPRQPSGVVSSVRKLLLSIHQCQMPALQCGKHAFCCNRVKTAECSAGFQFFKRH